MAFSFEERDAECGVQLQSRSVGQVMQQPAAAVAAAVATCVPSDVRPDHDDDGREDEIVAVQD